MGKSKAPSVIVKRESWKTGYHATARLQGRFVATRKWHDKRDTQSIYDKVITRNISVDSSLAYAYVVLAHDSRTKGKKPFFVYSDKVINVGSDKSKERKAFYKQVKELYISKYEIKLSRLKLVRTFDNESGIPIL